MATSYDAPRRQSVEHPGGRFSTCPWTRKELREYRIQVLGWSPDAASRRFDASTHDIADEVGQYTVTPIQIA